MPTDFAAILLLTLVAHNGVDHLVQRSSQAKHKVEPGWYGRWSAFVHGVEHAVVVLGLILIAENTGIITPVSNWGVVLGIGFLIGSHAFIDRRWPIKWLLEHTGSKDFAAATTPVSGMYVADQAAHWGCALIVAGLLALV